MGDFSLCETKWLVLIYFPWVKSLLLLFIKPKQKVFSRRIFFCEASLLQLCCNTHSDHTRLKCFTFIMSTKTNNFFSSRELFNVSVHRSQDRSVLLAGYQTWLSWFFFTHNKKIYFPNLCFTHGNKDETKNNKKNPLSHCFVSNIEIKKCILEKRTKHHAWIKKPFSFFSE